MPRVVYTLPMQLWRANTIFVSLLVTASLSFQKDLDFLQSPLPSRASKHSLQFGKAAILEELSTLAGLHRPVEALGLRPQVPRCSDGARAAPVGSSQPRCIWLQSPLDIQVGASGSCLLTTHSWPEGSYPKSLYRISALETLTNSCLSQKLPLFSSSYSLPT